jgi:hypothetical protein
MAGGRGQQGEQLAGIADQPPLVAGLSGRAERDVEAVADLEGYRAAGVAQADGGRVGLAGGPAGARWSGAACRPQPPARIAQEATTRSSIRPCAAGRRSCISDLLPFTAWYRRGSAVDLFDALAVVGVPHVCEAIVSAERAVLRRRAPSG